MSDLISRQAAIDALGERPRIWTGGDYELGCANQYDLDRLAIETAPSADAVKVVRCRDCKYFEQDGPYDGWCHGWSGMIVDDGYCSFGKASLDAEGDKWI